MSLTPREAELDDLLDSEDELELVVPQEPDSFPQLIVKLKDYGKKLYWDWVLPAITVACLASLLFNISIPRVPWCKLPGFKVSEVCLRNFGIPPLIPPQEQVEDFEVWKNLTVADLVSPLAPIGDIGIVHTMSVLRYGFDNLYTTMVPLTAAFSKCPLPGRKKVASIQERMELAGRSVEKFRKITDEKLNLLFFRASALSDSLEKTKPYTGGHLIGQHPLASTPIIRNLWMDFYTEVGGDIIDFRRRIPELRHTLTKIKKEAADTRKDFLKCYEAEGTPAEDDPAATKWQAAFDHVNAVLINGMFDNIEKYNSKALELITEVETSLSSADWKVNHMITRLEKSRDSDFDPANAVIEGGLARKVNIDAQIKAVKEKTKAVTNVIAGIRNYEYKIAAKVKKFKDDVENTAKLFEKEFSTKLKF